MGDRSRLNERFGTYLRALRTERKLTQEALAEKSDLSVDGIRRIERGAFSPSLDTIERLSRGLDVSLPTLFGGFHVNHVDEVGAIADLLSSRSPSEIRLVRKLLQVLFEA